MSIIATISIDTPRAASEENRVTVNCDKPSVICGRDGDTISDMMVFTTAYTYARMLCELPYANECHANFCYDGSDINSSWQEETVPTILLCVQDCEVELFKEGPTWDTQNYTFKRGKMYLFRCPAENVWDESTGVAEFGLYAPIEIRTAEELEEYFGFLGGVEE